MIKNVLKHLISSPATRDFPSQKRVMPADVRGAIEFHGENCTYCSACSLKCPTNAIEVDRKAQTLDFDLFRCIVCNCCVEACKKGCVQMATAYRGPQDEHLTVHFEASPSEKKTEEEAAPKPRPARPPRRAVVAEGETAPPKEESANSPMPARADSSQNDG